MLVCPVRNIQVLVVLQTRPLQPYTRIEHMFIVALLFLSEAEMSYMNSEQKKSMQAVARVELPRTTGIVLHSPVLYDLTVWLAFFGNEGALRRKILQLARVAAGEHVLDLGCGTGTLAIEAKRRVGPEGRMYALDASQEMLSRAEKKAKKAGAEVVFKMGLAEDVPFPGGQFDVVLSTVMLHHLPAKARLKCANEIRRILKPGGRVLAVDFEGMSDQKRTFLSHFQRPHGHVRMRDILVLLSEAGLSVVENGPVGIRDLHFVLAERPSVLPGLEVSS